MQVIKSVDKHQWAHMIVNELDERNVFIHQGEYYSKFLASHLILYGLLSVLREVQSAH